MEIYREGPERKFACVVQVFTGKLGFEFWLARIVRVLEEGVVGVCVWI